MGLFSRNEPRRMINPRTPQPRRFRQYSIAPRTPMSQQQVQQYPHNFQPLQRPLPTSTRQPSGAPRQRIHGTQRFASPSQIHGTQITQKPKPKFLGGFFDGFFGTSLTPVAQQQPSRKMGLQRVSTTLRREQMMRAFFRR